MAETAAEVDCQEFHPTSKRNGERLFGPLSIRCVSEQTGIPGATLNKDTRLVAAIDTYPELTPLPRTEAIATAILNVAREPLSSAANQPGCAQEAFLIVEDHQPQPGERITGNRHGSGPQGYLLCHHLERLEGQGYESLDDVLGL